MDTSKYTESELENYKDGYETGYNESKFNNENLSDCDSDTPWSVGFDAGFDAYKQERCDALETVKSVMLACADGDYKTLCEFHPEGVEHRTYTYKEEDDFIGEGGYEDLARYTYPARNEMKSVCLYKAVELMNKFA